MKSFALLLATLVILFAATSESRAQGVYAGSYLLIGGYDTLYDEEVYPFFTGAVSIKRDGKVFLTLDNGEVGYGTINRRGVFRLRMLGDEEIEGAARMKKTSYAIGEFSNAAGEGVFGLGRK